MPVRSSRFSDRSNAPANPFNHIHGTQQKRDHTTRTAEFLVERIRANLEEAARVLPHWFYHWTLVNEEVAPSAEGEFDAAESCPLSYGVGVLPGYCKHGFRTIIPVHANRTMRGVNVVWDYAKQRATPVLTMQPTAVWAEALTDWVPLGPNYGIELFNALVTENVQLEYTFDGSTWDNVNHAAFGQGWLAAARVRFRITLHRPSIQDPLPEMAGLVIRYQVVTQPAVRGDIPKFNLTRERDDLGLIPILETYPLYLNSEANPVQLGDFFEYVATGRRFKVVSHEPLMIPIAGETKSDKSAVNLTGGQIGTDIQVRLCQPDEPLSKIK